MKCLKCKKKFNQRRPDQVYCSRKCQQANKPSVKNRLSRPLIYREIVLSCFDGECKICGSNHKLNIHHIIPRTLGGKNSINNITILCEKCHQEIHREHLFLIYPHITKE